MSDDVHVRTATLRSVGELASEGRRGLDEVRAALDDADAALQEGAVLDQRGGADDAVASFTRRWRDELDLIGRLLVGVRDALDDAAGTYEGSETSMGGVLDPAGGG